jgi:hypothetical protein
MSAIPHLLLRLEFEISADKALVVMADTPVFASRIALE